MLPLAERVGARGACPCAAGRYTAGKPSGERGSTERPAKAGGALHAPSLALLTTSAGKCADESAGVCSSRPVIKVLAQFAGTRPTAAPEAVVEKAVEKVEGCDDEACVVTSQEFLSHVRTTKGEQAVQRVIVDTREKFKTPGPRDSKALLSNFNIDEVLQRWAKDFPGFFNCPFAMIDFDRQPQYQLGLIDMDRVPKGQVTQKLFSAPRPRAVRRKCDTFGCVLNTDVSTGKGKHWVCVFVDMRPKDGPWTVEYFNSSGRAPPREVTAWMERAADDLRKLHPEVVTVPVTDVAHQKGDTECGLYAMYYIRARLEGVPWTKFKEWTVPDALMTEFRTHIFAPTTGGK